MSKAAGTPAVGIDPPVGAEPHLRAVIERQPVVLARVGRDGTFLAVNEAGLSMLGAQALEQVLGTSLLSMVDQAERGSCQALIERALDGQRGSCEADLTGFTSSHQTLELHATAHPGAPDSIPSVLISFRDVTESRRLEQSLVDAAARQAEQEAEWALERNRLRAELAAAARTETDQFALDEQFTQLERQLAEALEVQAALRSGHAEEIARLNDALAEQRRRLDSQTASAVQLDGSDRQLAELRGRFEALESERQQLLEMAELLKSEAEARQQTVAELTERIEGIETERHQAFESTAALQRELDERQARLADLTARLESLETERQQGADAIATLQRELESRTALASELAARIESLEAEQTTLREQAAAELASLRASTSAEIEAVKQAHEAERAQAREQADRELASAREAAAAELDALRQAHAAGQAAGQSSLQELQARYDTDTNALRDALNGAMGEQARLAELMAEAEHLAEQKAGQLTALEQTFADERTAAEARIRELESGMSSRVADLEGKLAEAEEAAAALRAERDRAEAAAAARIAELEAAHAVRLAELEAGHASRLAELEAAAAQATERADDALAAIQRAEEAFTGERQRLEDALLAAVDAERSAKQALSTEIANRTLAERSHRQMQAAIERFAQEAGVTIAVGGAGAAAPARAATSTKALAARLNDELPRRLGDGLSLTMLASGADAKVAVDEQAVLGAIFAFADSRRLSMLSGQVTVEIAEVTVDDGVGHARGMSPGPYALIAITIDGPGAQQGFAPEIFNSADPRGWRQMKEELQAARSAIVGAGGQIWVTHEGASVAILEFYLPREGAR